MDGMKMLNEKEQNQKRWKNLIITEIISIGSFLVLIMIVVLYTDVISLQIKVIITAIAVVMLNIGIYFGIKNERTIGYYKCPNCNTLFVPNIKEYILGAHIFSTRKLKCPNCGMKKYCKKVMTKEE